MSKALSVIASQNGVSQEEVADVIKNMIVSGKNQHGATATNAEMTVVSSIFAKYDLNPFIREGHAFVSGGKLQVMIGIDGWIKIMNRQPNFDGVEFEDHFENGELISVTTKIYIKDRSHPVCAVEYMDECYQPTSPAWKKFKKRMLRNKSLGQCIRIAFGVSELIDDDEASRIKATTKERDITPKAPAVNIPDINTAMGDCNTIDELKEFSGGIRVEMQQNGTWETHKADITSLFNSHADRINSIADDVDFGDDAIDVDIETGEIIENEVVQND